MIASVIEQTNLYSTQETGCSINATEDKVEVFDDGTCTDAEHQMLLGKWNHVSHRG